MITMDGKQQAGLHKLWGEGALRVFISHTAPHKQVAKDIQERLNHWGIASFVAHEDIEPMKEWEGEIEKALKSMGLLVALLTEDFGQSKWTDQEVGFAVGRDVHVVPVRMGKDPYGFMGRYQAMSGASHEIARSLFEYALREDSLEDAAVDAFILAAKRSGNFDRSNELSEYFPEISQLSATQEESLVQAFNNNDQIHRAYEWADIVENLKRWTGNAYVWDGQQLYRGISLEELPW